MLAPNSSKPLIEIIVINQVRFCHLCWVRDTQISVHMTSCEILKIVFTSTNISLCLYMIQWEGRVEDQRIGAEWRIYASVNYIIIGSDNGLSPVRRQPITWTSDGLLSIKPRGTHFSEFLFQIQNFSFKKMHMKMSYSKIAAILSQPQCFKRLPSSASTAEHLIGRRQDKWPDCYQ